MKYFARNEPTTPVDEQIEAVLSEMEQVGVTSEEYPKLMTYLERLNLVKRTQMRETVTRDTMALVLGNLAGVLLLGLMEKTSIISAKGFSHLFRPKI